MNDDEDNDDNTLPSGTQVTFDPTREIDEVMSDLEGLLKNGDVVGALTTRGINASIALMAIEGLRSYLAGRKLEAADDFGTVTEEIRGRLESTMRGQN